MILNNISEAEKYNKKVKRVKLILLIIFIGSFLGFVIMPIISINIIFKLNVLNSSTLKSIIKGDINPPVVSGITKNGTSYYISAEKITNNAFNIIDSANKEVTLTNFYVLISNLKDKLSLNFSSKEALYNAGTNIITVQNPVSGVSNKNDNVELSNLMVNLANNAIESSGDIKGIYSGYHFSAKGVKTKNFLDNIYLYGPVEIK